MNDNSMEERRLSYIYLHGLGQTAASWQSVLEKLPEKGECLDLVGLIKGKNATYANLYGAVSQTCDAAGDSLVLCGLSLGAVLALNYAIDHPEKVKALVLIAAQYKMPRALLAVQNVMFRFMPESSFRQTGFQKADFVSLCKTTGQLDFSQSVKTLCCPVLLVCGEQDSANKKASKALASILPNAELKEIPGAGHEVNTQAPAALAEILQQFFAHL